MIEDAKKELTCPFCEEGTLVRRRCPACRKGHLVCDECESVYRDADSLDEELPSSECPHCGNPID
ncbi:MAG TPA: hypothetical protein PKM65_17155 [Spirochaetota bacterium]|nr:hypothetical protein [Spirochaetota bacterium]HNT12196.1 hypothetical protein [Spirochaetota bacterium]HNV48327.1 hypothetical protein [Spirochaetota bacterium]HOS39551.1 hypothetical protein [Spirochaetota bacterium]HPU90496.1 hypothetical protein [Spirochaetota bacterium]